MKRINFNQGWQFQKAGTNHWQEVNLPHDAMIHEPRDPESEGGAAVGYFPGNVYIYEKTFTVPVEWREQCITFEFEGIYKNSKVVLNGQEAGGTAYGYTRFFVQADPYLRYGEENTIRVTADNAKMPNSRWYSGSGIYRPVHLLVQNKTHIALDGVKISTLSYAPAKILVDTTANGGEIRVEILDGSSHVIATGNGASVELTLPDAQLWSAETPNLYQCRVTLTENGQVVDEVTETFGIRMLEWSSKGLFINGQNTLLRGGCIHHDNGILGAATFDKSEERRVRILKEAGYNAIRSAHNPTSKALLAACDRLGMYLIDETWDTWYMHKNKYDYATDFNDWYREDIRSMVAKDFNHPSVIMYSIANEVSEPYQQRGQDLTREMVDFIHSLDRNRAVTAGINLFIIDKASKGKGIYKEEGGLADEKAEGKKKQQASSSLFFNILASMVGTQMNNMANSDGADRITSPCLDALDIAGYNYASGRYAKEGQKHPNRVIYGSETFPQDIAKNWEMVKKYPYLVGDFMWTSWDYLGEAGMGAWDYDGKGGFQKPYPYLVAGCGAVDLIGTIGAPAKYAATVWGLEKKPFIGVRPVNHPGKRITKAIWRGTNAIDSWAWKNCEGNKAEIEVYADAHSVELFINGQSLGKKKLKAYQATFKTKYAPGSLKAIAYDQNGQPISEGELASATGKTSISLKPEETTVQSGELVYINVDLVGDNGIVESNADRELTITVEGGTLLGFGSANPRTEERFDNSCYTTYYGRSLAAVRADRPGALTVRATGPGIDPAEVKISVTD